MKFRNDISFLRAISVIAVILYHFKFTLFKGGFIGVDIFFVISGYLMTRIILTGFSKNDFSLSNFYKKRVIRIFPALLVMITFFAVLIYLLIPTQFINYSKSYFSSSLFFSNIYYYFNAGYFNAPSQVNFLLHTWSLSVEWQFYIVYPLILLAFRKTFINNKRLFISILLGLIFLSIGSMFFHYFFNRTYSFYMFYTRAWEMMFGGLAFLYAGLFKEKSIATKKNIFYFSIVTIILFIVFTDAHSLRWPSFITIIPVGLTTIILLIHLDIKLFSNKVVQYIGNISYSLYLWHWPLFVISLFFGLNDNFKYKMVFIVLSIILSIISYHFIEKRNYQKQYKLILCSTIILFLLSFSISKLNPNYFFDKYIANLVFATSNYKDSNAAHKQFSHGNKHLLDIQSFKNFNLKNLKASHDRKNIILLGDSHAAMFSQTINNIFDSNKYNVIQVTGDATYPMIDAEIGYPGPKTLFNYFFKDYFPKNYKKIDLVIISANYYDFYKDDLINKINFNENYFKKYHVPVVYLGQTDNYSIDFPTHYYLKNRFNVENIGMPQLTDKVHLANQYLVKRLGDRYINLLDYKIVKVSKDGVPYINDQNHLTYYGIEQYQNFIVRSLSQNKYMICVYQYKTTTF